MRRNIILVIILSLFIANVNSYAANKFFNSGDSRKKVSPDPIFNKTIIIPAENKISVKTNNTLSANYFSVSDKIYTYIDSDFYYNGVLIAEEGSIVRGIVTISKRATTDNEAIFQIKFTSIITPKLQTIPITAVINTEDKDGIIYGDKEIKQNSEIEIILKQPITYIPI